MHYILRGDMHIKTNEYASVHVDNAGDIYTLDLFVGYTSICGVNAACVI